MRIIGFIFSTAITLVLILALNTTWVTPIPFGQFLSPFQGFWQNAETGDITYLELKDLEGLKNKVSVHIDERRVPHIFAQNEEDLYFMQGYVTARDRLWQMDFFSYAAGGRLSELVGDVTLNIDRTHRRIGIPFGAKNAIELLDTDTLARKILYSFAKGVNTYINSLEYKDYPVEYKLMGYTPEEWTPYKTALLLKYMANMLAAGENDFEYTNALQLFDKSVIDILYPDFPEGIDPIIPSTTAYDFDTLQVDTADVVVPETFLSRAPYEQPEYENVGSNNWAVSGDKTASGYPILCNDPHLKLQLPSIWYEVQLHAPGVNAYGVTLPGAPGITIGFNENIAWGVTNAGRDVKDWYRIEYKDASRSEYKYDGGWKATEKVIEEIKVKGQPTYYDTVIYTHFGPVAYDDNFQQRGNKYPMALRWIAHDASNELEVFYKLNRATNHEDYLEALDNYVCPAQNFVFASKDGDVAIKQQGKFPLRWKEQGKFLMDGTTSKYEWQSYIPNEYNPHVLNPTRGFVSSANQHPTDATYPFYYSGRYEYYRNRRINDELASMSKITVDDMKRLQNDNMHLLANEVLSYLLYMLDPTNMNEQEKIAFDALIQWSKYNEKDLEGPTYFEVFWKHLYLLLWDELLIEDVALKTPNYYVTANFLINEPEHKLMDNKDMSGKQTAKDLTHAAFELAVKELTHWQDSTGKSLEWATYKATKVEHYARIEPFSIPNVMNGGNKHIVNATNSTHGPSWRMIVALGERNTAWGVYPGGQSGNPGNPYYSNFIDKWEKGEYYPLLFMLDGDVMKEEIIFTQKFNPAK